MRTPGVSRTGGPAVPAVRCAMLGRMGRMGRTFAFIAAHPDDEGYSSYGTVARHRDDPDFRLVVLHATDGEAGQIAPGVPTTPEELGPWRRQEDANAWQALGCVPSRHDWLGLPDGGLEEVSYEALRDAIASFLRDERPDVVATLPDHGVTGHPDHMVVSKATTEAFHVVRAEPGPGLRRLLHGAIRQSEFEIAQRWYAINGIPAWDPTRVYHLRGTPNDLFGIAVDNRPVTHLMLAAMKEHRSQRHVLFGGPSEAAWMSVMRREDWIIAWPPREPGTPVLDDVFAGLD